MSPPSIRINTFLEENKKLYIDTVSKYFFLIQAAFGYNRTYLLWDSKLNRSAIMLYCILCYVCLLFLMLHTNHFMIYIKQAILYFLQYVIGSLLSVICWKRITNFYTELHKFDTIVGCRPHVTWDSIKNLFQLGFVTILSVLFHVLPSQLGIFHHSSYDLIPVKVTYNMELAYYGHLLGLLIPRLKLINYYIESSLSASTFESDTLLKEYSFSKNPKNELEQPDMKKIMDIYHIIVEAYDYLIDAIKWQFLVTIVVTFIIMIIDCYHISIEIMSENKDSDSFYLNKMLKLARALVMMLPLFTPCVFGDMIRKKVKKLRELLASRLYENKLDKSGRRIARALLAFTETRNLSFRLLRMLDIDISLPFKFVGLLITYLIILLQFEKVIGG